MEGKTHSNLEVTEKAWLKKCVFISQIISLLKKQHSRRNQRYISTRSTSWTSGVDQGRLDESTTFAVKSATPWKIKIMF